MERCLFAYIKIVQGLCRGWPIQAFCWLERGRFLRRLRSSRSVASNPDLYQRLPLFFSFLDIHFADCVAGIHAAQGGIPQN